MIEELRERETVPRWKRAFAQKEITDSHIRMLVTSHNKVIFPYHPNHLSVPSDFPHTDCFMKADRTRSGHNMLMEGYDGI